jgi:lipid-binding SYLF domain-containing protein
MKPALARLALLFCVLLSTSSLAHAKDSPDEQRAKIKQTRKEVLAELYKLNPGAEAKIKKSVGYAVFSNVGVNLVLASFAGGHGVVVEKGMIKDTETYMKMGSAGLGIGLGVKDFRAVFVFTDKDKLQAFIDKGWDFSAQADAAAKSGEKGGQAAGAGNIAQGVEVFQITKNGLALQATLQGTKYWKDKDLN